VRGRARTLTAINRRLAPGPLDSGDAGVQRRGDPAVAPAFARIRYVRLQQDARLRQQLGGTLAFANQLVESIATPAKCVSSIPTRVGARSARPSDEFRLLQTRYARGEFAIVWMFLMRHAPRIQEAEFVPRMFVIGSKMLSATVARLTEVGS
jgi:hypothetical protein